VIRSVLFDLDGTLVQQLRGLSEPDAIEAYREIVGASREVSSRHVMERSNLEPDLRPLMGKHGVSDPVEGLTAMRKEIYDSIVADPQVLRDNQWSHSVQLLRIAKGNFCRPAARPCPTARRRCTLSALWTSTLSLIS